MRTVQTDYIVVGSGIAGLMTGLLLGNSGEVMILTKSREEASNSFRAQGGIAAAVGEGDSPELHREDTLRTGVQHCDPTSVDVLVNMAPRTIQLLTELGAKFDRDGEQWALGREGSHSAPRILHAEGDATGAAITRALLQQVAKRPHVNLISHTMVVDLAVSNGECVGVLAADAEAGATLYLARGVVLATGGLGQVYRYTTNDLVSTGDGFALARRAGVPLMDMEFVQFHPTALAVDQNPMFLVSEAVRGEGATLINDRGEAFMRRYHAWGDLAPRDVVSRAIYSEMQQGHRVYLDAGMIGERFARRFPTIYRHCTVHGIDPARGPIPVTPAAHFIMGGIRTDSYGQTRLSRLFACGEVACTGVHGANRLASNSLLEGAVFSQRVAERMAHLPPREKEPDQVPAVELWTDRAQMKRWKDRIRTIMWDKAGIIRTAKGLAEGLNALRELENEVPVSAWECRNMITASQAILQSALWRQESRGGHYRADFSETMEEWAKKHRVV